MRLAYTTASVLGPAAARRWFALLIVLVAATALLHAVTRPDDALAGWTSVATVFLGIFFEAAPFVLVGVIISSLIHVFVDDAVIARFTPRQPVLASLVGSLIGLAIPVCECGVVPVCRRLVAKGAPVSLGVALLLAAPVINPIVIASTWVAFGGDWGMVAWRVGLTIAISVVVGALFGLHPRPSELLAVGALTATEHTHRFDGAGDRLRAATWHAGAELVEMSQFLVLGALLAALMQTFVPRAALLTLGTAPLAAILVMIGLAVLLSVCSTVDAFIALSFAGAFHSGAIIAFLVFGPMIDVKSTLMFLSVFRRRAIATLVLLVFQFVVLASLVISYYTAR